MAFGFKNSPYDKLRDAYYALSDEDKAKFKAELQDIDKAEDEREIDKIEEEKADNVDIADTKAEEVNEESEQIGKDIDKAEDMAEDDLDNDIDTDSEQDNGFDEQVSAEETVKPTPNVENEAEELQEAPAVDYSAMQDTLNGLDAKYKALEQKFDDLLSKLGNGELDRDTVADVGVSGFGKSEVYAPEEDDRMARIRKSLGFKNY